MTHDPLCPYRPKISVFATYWQKEIPCQCDLIAKVRADELRRPSEDGWMSVRAVLEWDERIRADEREESIRRVTALWNRTREDEGGTPLLSDVKRVIRGDKS
jgi:hypothetical protein